jgi:hypothetical protein
METQRFGGNVSIVTQPPDNYRVFRDTVALLTLHSFLWAVGVFDLCWWGPRAESVFREFNMKLPSLTQFVLTLSRWIRDYAPYVGLFVFLVLVSDGLVYHRLRTSAPRFLSRLWSASMFFLPFAVIMGTMIGIITPLFALAEGLSR